MTRKVENFTSKLLIKKENIIKNIISSPNIEFFGGAFNRTLSKGKVPKSARRMAGFLLGNFENWKKIEDLF